MLKPSRRKHQVEPDHNGGEAPPLGAEPPRTEIKKATRIARLLPLRLNNQQANWAMAIDEEKIRQAIALFLEGIGEDPAREGLVRTPDRVARMCRELFSGVSAPERELMKTFRNPASNGLIVVSKISFYSVCEHHLVPFFGEVAIAYIARDGMVAGFSEFAKAVSYLARRPQIQEQMTTQLGQLIVRKLNPAGLLVTISARHLCMEMRGEKKEGTRMMTTYHYGTLDDPLARTEAYNLMNP